MNKEVKELIDTMQEYADGFTSVLAPTEESVNVLLNYINQLENTLNEVKEYILEKCPHSAVFRNERIDEIYEILNKVGGSNENSK